jgi:hypothetical protein
MHFLLVMEKIKNQQQVQTIKDQCLIQVSQAKKYKFNETANCQHSRPYRDNYGGNNFHRELLNIMQNGGS